MGRRGAADSLRFEGGATSNPDAEIWPRMYVPTKKAVVHHTATSNSYVDGPAEVRAIYTYHAVSLGWGDIGYSSLIDRDGTIYEGRHGRGAGETREVLSADVVAGHALSHNYGTTGVALIGTHTARGEGGKPSVVPADISWSALIDVLAFECARRGIDPQAANDFLRSDDAWNTAFANVPGHRDCNPTICPGGHVYDRLPSLPIDIAAAVANLGPAVSGLTGPAGDPVTDGLASYDWAGDGTSTYQHYLEGWRPLLERKNGESIDYLRPTDYDPAHGEPRVVVEHRRPVGRRRLLLADAQRRRAHHHRLGRRLRQPHHLRRRHDRGRRRGRRQGVGQGRQVEVTASEVKKYLEALQDADS